MAATQFKISLLQSKSLKLQLQKNNSEVMMGSLRPKRKNQFRIPKKRGVITGVRLSLQQLYYERSSSKLANND